MSDFPVIVPYHKRPSWFWRVIFIGAPLAFGLGTVGFWIYDKKPAGIAPWFDALYHSLQLFILHMPHVEGPMNWCLELGRWLAAALFGMAALIALYDLVMRDIQQFRLRFAKGHVVICGQGPKVIELVKCYAGKGKDKGPTRGKDANHPQGEGSDQDKDPIRDQGKKSALDQERDKEESNTVVAVIPLEEDYSPYHAEGAFVIVGDPTSSSVLSRARIQTADRVIALCSNDNTNVQVAVKALNSIQEKEPYRPKPLRCFVHLSDVDLRASLHRTAVFGDQCCQVQFFDLFDAAARELLLSPVRMGGNSNYTPLDHGGILETDPKFVRLVILGFGRMGRTMAVRAAQLGHFANRKPIQIAVIDKDADRHKEMLLFRYPSFEQTCNIEFHNLEVETKQARTLLESWCAAENSYTSIAVCFDQDSLALEVALRLFPKLEQFKIPMAVRMSQNAGFVSLLKEGHARPDIHGRIRGFGMLADTCREDVLENRHNEKLARAIHEDFCAQRKKEGRIPPDPSVLPWDELNPDFKDSNRQQADHIDIKLRGIGCMRVKEGDSEQKGHPFTPGEIEIMARMEHARWKAERLLAGWILGPKESSPRSNPFLIRWEELPQEVQEYDREAVGHIPDYLREIGEKVCRSKA